MTDLPAPLVAADVDLRDFAFMPLDVARLRDSDLACAPDGEVFRANVLSWCVGWHQVPAASLPNDEATLARLLGYGRDIKTWRRVRADGGLRGWVLCSDGRLYHPVVAEKATEAWSKKQAFRDRTEKARAARLSKLSAQPQSQTPPRSVTETTGTGDRDRGQGEPSGSDAKASSPGGASAAAGASPNHDPRGTSAVDPLEIPLFMLRVPDGDWSKPLFRQGLAWLARATDRTPAALRPLLGKALKLAGNDHKRVFDLLAEAERDAVADPPAWLLARLGNGAEQRSDADLKAFDRQIDRMFGNA